MNVEIKCSLRAKFEGLQCPQAPQLSGTIGTKSTLTSNTGESNNFFVHGIGRVTIFYADVKGGSQFFSLNNISEFATLLHPPHNFWPLPNAIQYNTIQYNTIQYNTIQYNTIQYNTIQYNTIQF